MRSREIYTNKVKKLGNSGYVPLPKEEIGRDAVTIVIASNDGTGVKNKEEQIFEQMTKLNKKLRKLEKMMDSEKIFNENTITDVIGKDKRGNLILGKEKKMS